MRVLITGCKGQLGYELQRSRPPGVEVTSCGLPEVDVTNPSDVRRIFAEARPEVIVNAAAYTNVDRAEEERDAAFAVNSGAVGHIIDAARPLGARLLHISTDFVFDGAKGSPYLPEDPPHPLGVYGESKAAGERVALDRYPEGSFIVRTAWLYSAHGQNFVKTMLRLFGERDRLGVVADQIGTPTWAFHLARFLWRVATSPNLRPGVFHFTDAGVASWYDFAVAIEEESRQWRGKEVLVTPLRTDEYPTKARRPSYSVMEKRFSGLPVPFPEVHWRRALRRMLQEVMPE